MKLIGNGRKSSVPVNPNHVLNDRKRRILVAATTAVALLEALDFVERHGGKDEFVRRLTAEQGELLRNARRIRSEMRAERVEKKLPAEHGEDENLELERRLVASQRMDMTQGEYQQLEVAYSRYLKAESIERFKRIRIRFVQGGAPG